MLPNINGYYSCAYLGQYNNSMLATNGALFDGYNSLVSKITGTVNPGGTSNVIGFNASLCNGIYKDDCNTVQPAAIVLIPQVRY